YILFVVIQDFFFKTFYRDYTMLFFRVLLSTIFIEIYVAIIYSILGLIAFDLFDFVLYRLIPTLVLNFILLIIFYPIITKFFRKVQLKIDSKKP
ncbi:rod shape-determining protein MreD, partial [Staphylococcus aureus]|uniref:rod shape-determining protein MreD n=1 Tax=Staphylococcus aureus TaxID=1280 RepID=UPI0030F3BFF9